MKRYIFLLLTIFFSLAVAYGQDVKHVNDYYRDAEQAYNKHQWNTADSLALLYCNLCETQLKDKLQSYPYSRMLDLRAHCAAQVLAFDRAIELQHKAVAVRRVATDCEQQHLAAAINELALFYSYKGKYDDAIKQADEALQIFSKTNGQKSKFYAVALSNMASFLSSRGDMGDFQRAVQLGEEALNIYLKALLTMPML